ncbi:MAG: DUF2284 domain-containing protein [Candidatus Helarchaeota archaeon]|nr:DUF2284 domain-containing protein [Candidatus Helarchaeota archaeon]
MDEINELIKFLTDAAVKWGASRELTKYIPANKVVVDGWPRWKCMFGCEVYGNRLCCPPFVPSPEETKKLIAEYKHALLIGFKGEVSGPILQNHKKMQKTMIKLEKKAFDLNYPKALVFSTGSCLLCKKCIKEELDANIDPAMAKTFCRHKNKARLSMEAAGIDVFSTVENVGLKLETITEKNLDKLKYFGLLLIS